MKNATALIVGPVGVDHNLTVEFILTPFKRPESSLSNVPKWGGFKSNKHV